MKKLLAIICILIIICIGIFVKNNKINKETVNASDVENIENYISKIYMWKEITGEALPKFDDINNAPDLWIWEVVKRDLEDYEFSYNQIQEKAKELFSSSFKKQFPKDGTEYLKYDEASQKYIATGIGLDAEEDRFYIKNIEKTSSGYKVQISEYLVDYGNSYDYLNNQTENSTNDIELPEYDVYIKNLNGDIVSTIKSTDGETKTIEEIKNNIDKFSTKIIYLKNNNGKLYVTKVE